MEAVSYYDYSEYPADIQAQFAGMTRKPGPETILSYDYDAYNYPAGTSHTRQLALSGVVLKKWLATQPSETQAKFFAQHKLADAAIEHEIEREMAARRKGRYQEMAWKGGAFLGAGALVPVAGEALFGGAEAGLAIAPSGLPYITEAGLPASLQAAPAAATGSLAAGLSAAELATLASAGFGIYKGIEDQQMQEEALEMQRDYLESEKARALVDAGLVYVPQPQTGQPLIYQTPPAEQIQNYMPLLIVVIAAFLLFKKGKI